MLRCGGHSVLGDLALHAAVPSPGVRQPGPYPLHPVLLFTFAGGQLRPLAVFMGTISKQAFSGLCCFGKDVFFFKPKWVITHLFLKSCPRSFGIRSLALWPRRGPQVESGPPSAHRTRWGAAQICQAPPCERPDSGA